MLAVVTSIAALAALQTVFSLGEDNYTGLLEYVEDEIAKSNQYILPVDNSRMLQVEDTEVHDYGQFDFIIIGAGPAGSIVASRLSEISQWKVLVLEAGGFPTSFLKILGLETYFTFTDFNWGYNTTSQKHSCLAMIDQQCIIPRGKAFGGSSAINGAQYARGHEQDYDIWANLTGDDSWSYKNVLPFFKKSEKAVFAGANPKIHGFDGLLTVNMTNDIPGLTHFLIKAYEEKNIKNIDLNDPHNIGVGKIQNLLKGNERVNTAEAFLTPFFSRSNLNISVNSFVTKILISNENKTALGVEFVKDKKKFVARISKEVIVSGGSINSPQILMLSGLGPKDHLKEHNITVINSLPVGQHLKDHVMYFGILLRKVKPVYTQDLAGLLKLYTQHLEPLIAGAKIMSYTNFDNDVKKRGQLETFFVVPTGSAEDIQKAMRLTDQSTEAYKNSTNTSTDIMLGIVLLHPKSYGAIKLQSNNPADFPLIAGNYLSNEDDVENIYKGVIDLLSLIETESFKKENVTAVIVDTPGCEMYKKLSKKWWYCSIKTWSFAVYHAECCNKMGRSPSDSVVDSKLKVHGMKNIRVADASVFPDTVSSHTVTPTMMVGERAGEIIKKSHGV